MLEGRDKILIKALQSTGTILLCRIRDTGMSVLRYIFEKWLYFMKTTRMAPSRPHYPLHPRPNHHQLFPFFIIPIRCSRSSSPLRLHNTLAPHRCHRSACDHIHWSPPSDCVFRQRRHRSHRSQTPPVPDIRVTRHSNHPHLHPHQLATPVIHTRRPSSLPESEPEPVPIPS